MLESITITITDPLATPLKCTVFAPFLLHHIELYNSFSWFRTPSKFFFAHFLALISWLLRKHWYNRKLSIVSHDRAITPMLKFQTFCDLHFIHFSKFCFVTSLCMLHFFSSNIVIIIMKMNRVIYTIRTIHITSISISISIKRKKCSDSYLLTHSQSTNSQYCI